MIVSPFILFFFFLMIRRPPRSTLFPYRRSSDLGRRWARVAAVEDPGALERGGEGPSPVWGLDLERAVAAVPEGARQVFLRHDVEGDRQQEIGQLLGNAAGTPKAQLFSPRRPLRETLD